MRSGSSRSVSSRTHIAFLATGVLGTSMLGTSVLGTVVFGTVVLGTFAACGDDGIDGPPDPTPACKGENPQGLLPTEGMYLDPYAIELPEECVEGGLSDLPGRWWVSDLSSGFAFDYPKYTGTCETGFRRHLFEDQHDPMQSVVLRYTWSDGTRFYTRTSARYEREPDPPYESYSAYVACVLPDGTVAARRMIFDTDRGERQAAYTGTRFQQKEPELAKGLEFVGAASAGSTGTPIEGLNLVIDGTRAYVVGLTGLDIVDVSNPAQPVALGHLDGNFNDVRFVRTADKVYAFGASSDENVVPVIDVTDPTTPTVVTTIQEYAHSLQIATRPDNKTWLYLANYSEAVPIYDVTNPPTPVLIGMPMIPGPPAEEPAGIHDLAVDGDRIIASNTSRGVFAFDVAPADFSTTLRGSLPTEYSHYNVTGTVGGRRVILHGDEGMTPEGGAFLRVLDGDPASPGFMTELARYQSRPDVGIHNFQLVGNKLYIAYYQDGVRVVDLSSPTEPREVAHHNTYDYENARGTSFEGAVGIRVVDGLIYVADINRGLLIYREP